MWIRRWSFWTALGMVALTTGCHSPKAAQSSSDLPSDLAAKATGVGYANAAMGTIAAFDPTGVASVGTMVAGRSMRNAMLKDADRQMREQQKVEEQELYKRYGMNPDGTPSGKPGSGPSAAEPEG